MAKILKSFDLLNKLVDITKVLRFIYIYICIYSAYFSILINKITLILFFSEK